MGFLGTPEALLSLLVNQVKATGGAVGHVGDCGVYFRGAEIVVIKR
jgi:hypothetical protein